MLDEICRLLNLIGRAEIRFGILSYEGEPVAMLNPSKSVVVLPVRNDRGDVVEKARNIVRGETAEDIAKIIIARRFRAAA